MLTSAALFAAVAVVTIGSLILWSNPDRWLNRLVFTCSLHIACWLGFLHLALGTTEGLVWVRWATSVSGLIPLHFWLVKEGIASDLKDLRGPKIFRIVGWVVSGLALSFLPHTEYFIPSHSTALRRLVGPGYYLYFAGVAALYIALGVFSYRRLRTLVGGRRLALQVWLGGGCATAGTILFLMAANAITHDSRYIKLQPVVVLVYYTATAFAITTHRIFDARQLVLITAEKLILVAAVAASAFALDSVFALFVPEPLAFFITTALALWIAVTLNAWLDGLFRFYPQATSARQAAFTAARNETRIEKLENAFRSILKGWGQTEHALIVSGSRLSMVGEGIEVMTDSDLAHAMRDLRWATPERLVRERSTAQRHAVSVFLSDHELGALVMAEGPALTVLLGVGVSASRRPFTYPQMTQLMELASIMESALERTHFSTKVQHTEQLATVGLLGASLAHEIRNPLVSIKTFVQLLPTHYQDPIFRDKFFRLIGDEVGRIDQLTEQLLDLASPRTYEAKLVELHPLLRSSLDLVAAKAAHRNVEFLTEFQASPDAAFTDASAAKQVMLNLCFNAIQAVEEFRGEQRWVKIATRNTPGGIEMMVADSGPGISAEMRPKLFQPFQTTKSTGFGLGLAICSDILSHLHASISVDPPLAGQGATFRVTFPCQPLSS